MSSTLPATALRWKANWDESKRHLLDWWKGVGLVVGSWFPPLAQDPRPGVEAPWPKHPPSPYERNCNAHYRAALRRAIAARQWFGLDCLPVADCRLGPGSLATMLGSEPEFGEHTTWFHPCWHEVEEPERLSTIKLDLENRWFQTHLNLLREARQQAGDDYAVGMPDLVEGLDILASLRDPNHLLMDLVERPDWVAEKVMEINQVWFAVFDRFWEICRTRDNWTFNSSFMIAGPGRTGKMQCDLAAMISPAMFARFAVPHLAAQCQWLDHSLFHLDGSECLDKLDLLLAIKDLDAIEWSPDPKSGGCENPRWYDLYKRIRQAGKAVQVINLAVNDVVPLLDAVGPQGMYLLVILHDLHEAEELTRIVERYRPGRTDAG